MNVGEVQRGHLDRVDESRTGRSVRHGEIVGEADARAFAKERGAVTYEQHSAASVPSALTARSAAPLRLVA